MEKLILDMKIYEKVFLIYDQRKNRWFLINKNRECDVRNTKKAMKTR